jgi:hypothetical protein
MPLTSKGKKIIAAMVKQYGKKKGKEVFYASKNKGTDKIKKIDVTRKLSSGNTRTKRVGGKLARGAVKAALKTADWDTDQSGRQADNIEVPERRGKNKGAWNTSINVVDHAVYKQMGVLVAEALGHRVDEIAPVLAGAARGLAMAAKAGGRMAGQAAKAGVQKAGQAGKAGAQKAGQAGKEMAKDAAIKAGKEKLQNKLAGPEEEPEDE